MLTLFTEFDNLFSDFRRMTFGPDLTIGSSRSPEETTSATRTNPSKLVRLNMNRGYNYSIIKDEKGNPIRHVIDIEHTPFKKEDVKVTLSDNVLHIVFNKTTKEQKKNEKEEIIFDKIYSEDSEITLVLDGKTLDLSAIKAKCSDGILHIELPVLKPVPPPPKKEVQLNID